jgi:alpha-glucosidase
LFRMWCTLWMGLAVMQTTSSANAENPKTSSSVTSPDGSIRLVFALVEGAPTYRVEKGSRVVLRSSKLGFKLRGGPSLHDQFETAKVAHDQVDRSWTQVWGECQKVRDRHNQMRVSLAGVSDAERRLDIVFRVFDDGISLRYEIPRQSGLGAIEIDEELTEFRMTADHRAWWIPAFQPNRYEYRYTDSPLSAMDKVHTPVTLQTSDGLLLSIHEAALTDFSSMALARKADFTLQAELFPWSDGVKVRGDLPLRSPWRTIQIAEQAGDLIESNLILNLNEPNRLKDVAWIKPGKYVGIWWEMHLGLSTWHAGPKHGATTPNAKHYIDFAAEHGFDGVLVEGWNIGWDGQWTQHPDRFNFTRAYPDFDLEEVCRYAHERGVRLIGHHETAGGVENYERQLEEAFALYHRLGVRAVKTGYVAHGQPIVRTDADGRRHKEWHHGQYMVRHYRKVVEMAAKYQIMLDVHEPIKDTGIRRTYPNMMTREGACGQEFNAWGGARRNRPDHTLILPFTRLLAGPMDFTPGIFDVLFEDARPGERVSTTLAKQLALYVVIYSPLHMAADLPRNYLAQPEAFQFIKDVPTDWAATRVLHAEIGDIVAIARKDRAGADWYLGAITDEHARKLNVRLAFLEPGQTYRAEIYRDANDADWATNPHAFVVERRKVTRATDLPLELTAGGGVAIRFRPEE